MTSTAERVVTYLLVDDSDDHADIVKRCIGHAKLPSQIHRVSNGADCLSYLGGEERFADRAQYPYPDVVLLDIRMPGVLNGLQTLQAIRSDRRHRSLVVIMLTTSDRESEVNRAYELGANGYIVKSDDTEEMIEKLLHMQYSHNRLVQLPKRDQEPLDHSPPPQTDSQTRPPEEVEYYLQSDQNAAFDCLVSGYRKDRDEMLRLLKSLQQVSPSRFVSLVYRFCVEKRHLFAGGKEVDWVFLQKVVMDKLPQCTSPEKMAGVVTGILAVLEENQSADRDSPSWHAWQGFCRAYMNQSLYLPSAPTEQDEDDPPPSFSYRKAALGAVLLVLTGVVAYLLGKGGF